jgi:CheY-like chemotaxis protein
MANILVVDDDIVNSQLLVNKLTSSGHSVMHATDGHAAMANVSQKYDLILLDIMMPKVDGITLLTEFKKGVNENTIILIFTNLFVEETKKKCMELGATDVLLKVDFTPQTIVGKIEEYLKQVKN